MFYIKIHEKVRKFIINNSDEKKIESFCKKNGKLINIRFGEVLIFLTNNYHYIQLMRKIIRGGLLILDIKIYLLLMEQNLMDFYEIFNYSYDKTYKFN